MRLRRFARMFRSKREASRTPQQEGSPAVSTPGPHPTVDLDARAQELRERVAAVYERVQFGTLQDDDLIDIANVDFAETEGFCERLYLSEEEFDEILKDFKVSYSPFSEFPKGSIVLDIGSDWGYSVIALRHQGCQAQIISIEATFAHAASLNKIKSLDNGNYDWINVAVGESEGELKFYVPVLNGRAITGLVSTGGTLTQEFIEHIINASKFVPYDPDSPYEFGLAVNVVKASRIDDILCEYGLPTDRVVAVKMDVEGHEGFAVAGAQDLFETQKPLLMIEGANRDERVNELLTDFGYFHCELHDGCLVPQMDLSLAQDGYWIHPARSEEYRRLGLFNSMIPSVAEIMGQKRR